MKLNNIQVLRAFAAVAVVVFHTGFAFPFMRPFGSFGVDVFFVISGYIMARILDPQSSSSSDFFFRRRIIRIVPPYWFFTILLYLIAFRIPQLMGSTRASSIDLLKSLFFIPFTKGSGLIQPLLFIGWSLNYEMFFYLALTIGLLIYKRRAIWVGAACVLAVMLACIPFAGSSTVAQFYSRDIFPFNSSRVLTLGLFSFLLVTTASLLSKGDWDALIAPLVLIGDASYILYLIHPYCEYALDRIFAPHMHWLKRDTATGALAGVTLSIVLAIVLHLYCERPTMRFLNRNFGGKRKSTEFAATS